MEEHVVALNDKCEVFMFGEWLRVIEITDKIWFTRYSLPNREWDGAFTVHPIEEANARITAYWKRSRHIQLHKANKALAYWRSILKNSPTTNTMSAILTLKRQIRGLMNEIALDSQF